MSFDASRIADLWRCPKSHSPLVVVGDSAICTNAECRLKYEIRDSIPVMLIDEAQSMPVDEWNAALAQTRSSSDGR